MLNTLTFSAPAVWSLQDVDELFVPGKGGNPPPPLKPSKWVKLVYMFQFMWECGNNPEDLGWTFLIIIPNGNLDIGGTLSVDGGHYWYTYQEGCDGPWRPPFIFCGDRHGESHNVTDSRAGYSEYGSGPAILGVPEPHKSVWQFGLWSDIEDIGEIQSGAKNAGNCGRVMGAAGGGCLTKLVPWPPVQGNSQNHTSGPDISDTL